MARNKDLGTNLLELIPERNWESFLNEDQRIVVNMPRFHIPWMQKFFVPRWKDPYIKIKLDDFGTLVWNSIDGERSILDIANMLVQQYGEDVQPVEDRIGLFFTQLKSRGFVTLRDGEGNIYK